MIKYILFSTQWNSTVYYTSALKGKKPWQLLWNNCIIADLSPTQTQLAATQATRKSPRSILLGKSITDKKFIKKYFSCTLITWIWGHKIRFLHILSYQWHPFRNQASNEQICIQTSTIKWNWSGKMAFIFHPVKLLNTWKPPTEFKFSGLNHFSRLPACMKVACMNDS